MKKSQQSAARSRPRSPSIPISSIADVIKIWRKGLLYQISERGKAHCKAIVIKEINSKTHRPDQAALLETLRNVLEG